MSKHCILLLLLLFPFTIRRQEDIHIGKTYTIHSSVLNEEREYWVHLPEKYQQEDTVAYSVIYLLDGDSFFHALIDSSYRTNGQNILIGHSYAGLFTLNTFLHHTELFEVNIALDPSLWWDNGKLVDQAATCIKEKNFTGKSLYIEIASKKRTDREDIHQTQVSRLIAEILPQAQQKHLRFFNKSFPDESHGTITIPGIYDGIKQLFGK